MAETASIMIPLGTKAPSFQLMDSLSEKMLSLEQLKSNQATVVMFICNHCPYVKLILPFLLKFVAEYEARGVKFIAINSNDVENYPADSPEHMKALAIEQGFSFPYLFDETQEVAKAYRAACTPDFFVFDKGMSCVYRGRFDAATPGNGKEVNGRDLGQALDRVLMGLDITQEQIPSLGCNIKWKKK